MIYPDVTVEEWCEKHKIDLVVRCCICDTLVTKFRPWLSKKYAGFSGTCNKGHKCSTSVHRDEVEGLQLRKEIFGWLTSK